MRSSSLHAVVVGLILVASAALAQTTARPTTGIVVLDGYREAETMCNAGDAFTTLGRFHTPSEVRAYLDQFPGTPYLLTSSAFLPGSGVVVGEPACEGQTDCMGFKGLVAQYRVGIPDFRAAIQVRMDVARRYVGGEKFDWTICRAGQGAVTDICDHVEGDMADPVRFGPEGAFSSDWVLRIPYGPVTTPGTWQWTQDQVYGDADGAWDPGADTTWSAGEDWDPCVNDAAWDWGSQSKDYVCGLRATCYSPTGNGNHGTSCTTDSECTGTEAFCSAPLVYGAGDNLSDSPPRWHTDPSFGVDLRIDKARKWVALEAVAIIEDFAFADGSGITLLADYKPGMWMRDGATTTPSSVTDTDCWLESPLLGWIAKAGCSTGGPYHASPYTDSEFKAGVSQYFRELHAALARFGYGNIQVILTERPYGVKPWSSIAPDVVALRTAGGLPFIRGSWINKTCTTPQNVAPFECGDSVDNDGDGDIDYPGDDGCVGVFDATESTDVAVCGDSIDNDSDELVDYPDDPGCTSINDDSEYDHAVCGDGIVSAPEQCDPETGVQAPCAYGDSDGCIVCSGQNSGAKADVTLYTTVPTSGNWNMAGVEIKASGTNVVAIDATATSVPSVAGAATVTGFSTVTPDDLIVAFTSFDSTGGAQNVTVTGGGLTWTRVARSYLVAGEAAIWTATASGTLSSVSITATPSQTKRGFLKVVAFRNTSGIGATAIANAATGAATIVVPGALSGSWSWAVGMDWDNSGLMCTATNPDTYRCYPSGQISQDEIGVSGAGTFWVQSQSAPSPFGAACQNVAGIMSYCGDANRDVANGEECDDGNQVDGIDTDVCFNDCTVATHFKCNNGIDDDRDGATDYLTDTGCTSANDDDEHGSIVCDDGVDNDSDGLFDSQIGGAGDPGCISIADTGERGASVGVPTQCDDNVDNDSSGLKDYATSGGDPNCSSAYDTTEAAPVGGGTAQCEDGIDNDGDGLIDLFAPDGNEALGDTGCATLDDDSESVGIPAGTVLTSYSGPYTITTPGTVIDSKDITQPITIAANNVTIRKSRIRSTGSPVVKTPINATNYGNIIEDSLIDGLNGASYCVFHNDGNASQTSFTLERVEMKGCGDMFAMGRSTVISNNYWHDNWNPPGAHGDALEMNGGLHQWAHHNVILGNYTTGSISHGDYYCAVSDILFEKNYVGGSPARLFVPGSGGNIFCGGQPADGVDYWRIAYNRLRCSVSILPVFYPTDPQYGNVSQNDHLTWTGNTCASNGAITDEPILGGGQPSNAGWVRACANTYDDDHDGLTDMADSGCSSSSDNLE